MYRNFRNTFIFGEPGTGKSKLIRSYIEEIIYDKTENSEIILISHKDLGYRSGKITLEVMNNYDEKIKEIHDLYLKRLEMEEVKMLPKIYIFLDGLSKTLRVTTKETEEMLGDLMANGLKANMVAVYASSSSDVNEKLLQASSVIELK